MCKPLKSLTLPLLLGLITSLGMLVSLPAKAGGVDSALKSLLGGNTDTSLTGAGYYQSEARGSFVGGGAQIRWPQTTAPSLFSVTAPSLSIGCSGISVYFGGFSFISGSQIKQMVQEVSQAAVGMAIDLAMTTLCSPCAHVMQVMRALAKDAANTAINACQVGQQLADAGYQALTGDPPPSLTDSDESTCDLTASGSGQTSDILSGLEDVCKKGVTAEKTLQSDLENDLKKVGISPTSQQGAGYLCKQHSECNSVWALLNATPFSDNSVQENVRTKLIIMNVMGTDVYCGGDQTCIANAPGGSSTSSGSTTGSSSGTSSSTSASAPSSPTTSSDTVPYAPMLGNLSGSAPQMDAVFTLFMCGTEKSSYDSNPTVNTIVTDFCNNGGQGTTAPQSFLTMKVWDCENSGVTSNPLDDAYTNCYYPKSVELQDSGMAGEGYLPYVADLMEEGVQAVIQNKPMPPEVISLIQMMPAPVYEAINDAAVYPVAGQQLLADMSVYCAQLLVDADLRQMAADAARVSPDVPVTQKQLEQFEGFLSGMRAVTEKNKVHYAEDVTMQQTLMKEIQELNVTMQEDVVSPQLLGASQFSNALVGATQGQ